MTQTRITLLERLRRDPSAKDVPQLVDQLEQDQPADLPLDADLLSGVWELRWSSSTQPWLREAPWLDNLQALDPRNGRGCNLLRPRGALGTLAAISVQADLKQVVGCRFAVRFRRGGWVGPQLPGGRRLQLLRDVQQSFPAWLDITVLDQQLRICRGNAGTTFALLRRSDIPLTELFDAT